MTTDNDGTTLGDPTLVGTHLHLMTDFFGGAPRHKFQLTSAAGVLDADASNRIAANLPSDTGKVMEVLAEDGRPTDPRFAAVLRAATSQPPQSSDATVEGTGGLPDLRVISDFRTEPAVRTLEVHTIVELDESDLQPMTEALNAQDVDGVMAILRRRPLVDEFHMRAMLAAAMLPAPVVPTTNGIGGAAAQRTGATSTAT